MFKFFGCSIAFALALSTTAAADEVYTAKLKSGDKIPDIVYEADKQGFAIWATKDKAVRFYIKDLAGKYTGRTTYSGWFVVYGEQGDACPGEPVKDHAGKSVQRYGELKITWSNDANFEMATGRCRGKVGGGETIVGKRQ